MPSVLRQSGPKRLGDDGKIITPQAVIHFCRDCKFEGAPFGDTLPDGRREYWCGYQDGKPLCKGKGNGTR